MSLAEKLEVDSPAVALKVEIRRSARRKKTVSGRVDGDTIIVNVPANLSAARERKLVDDMVRKLSEKVRKGAAPKTDRELFERAQRIATEYLDPQVGRPVRPSSVRWVSNQNQRWGSCTIDDATIRLSDRMQAMPQWVVDYVLLHELVHLVEANHSPRFKKLLSAYPKEERAQGFLEGWTAAMRW